MAKKKEETKAIAKQSEAVEKSSKKKRGSTSSGDDEEPSVAASRPKRARNNPMRNSFEPEDFTMIEPEGIKISKGRGKKLKSIPSVKASIESSKHKTEDLVSVHRFVFGKKGKYTKKDMKTHLLEFSGYLKPIPAGQKRTEKEVEKEEELIETKYSKRAFALQKAQIVDLCTFFDLDMNPTKSEPKLDKDTCIDRLLDFLGAPHDDWVNKPGAKPSAAETKKTPTKKTPSKKPASPKAKSSAPAAPTTKSDYEKIKTATEKQSEPSEEVLRAWVRAYIACFNLDKATTKHAILTCSEKFGVDMTKKKEHIKQLLAKEM